MLLVPAVWGRSGVSIFMQPPISTRSPPTSTSWNSALASNDLTTPEFIDELAMQRVHADLLRTNQAREHSTWRELDDLPERVRDKKKKRELYAERALRDVREWAEAEALLGTGAGQP